MVLIEREVETFVSTADACVGVSELRDARLLLV